MWRDQVTLAVTDEAIKNRPVLAKTLANYQCVSKLSQNWLSLAQTRRITQLSPATTTDLPKS